MSGKFGLVLLSVFLILSITIMADSGERYQIRQVEKPGSVQEPLLKAACDFTKTTGTPMIIWVVQANYSVYNYYDAAVCGPSSYPFEITEFSFSLDDQQGSTIWPAYVDIVVRAPNVPGNPCSEPGPELCRFSVVADQATYAYPNAGTVNLPSSCCVDGPFFIGVEFTQGEANSTPGIIWDNQTIPTCEGWAWTGGSNYSDYSTWSAPPPLTYGYALYWIGGNPNSINCGGDQCYWEPGDDHKMHFPQLPDEAGWDVNATQPLVLADDFMCMQSGPITDVHWWGSWKHGIEGEVISFVLSIHEDIPADPPQVPYSRPGITLWEREVSNFGATPKDPPSMEGWYDPATGEFFPDDHQAYFQYDVCFDPEDQGLFHQDFGTIYWLNISAIVADPQGTQWGWKSSQDHWNDDAVWAFWGELDWIDMWEPPNFMQSLDLAFVITGEEEVCDCIPGDANNDGAVNVGDAVYLIAYVFKGGPPPVPYPICSGDANCDCSVNVGDAVYIISYVFKGGPPPCDCPTWLAICGPPLRK